jgi:type I restriction enzyme, S subunit
VCRSTGIRSSRLRLYPEKFLQIPLVLPPHEEQEQLAATIAEETLQTDYAIDRARCEIDLLREYRTRLIADVVTGKLDVRGVELPALDETEAPEDWETGEDAEVVGEMDEMEGVDA